MKHTIAFTPSAREDLRFHRKHEQVLVVDAVSEKLKHQPGVETKHRKPMREGHLARWELSVEAFRVFYNLDEENRAVEIIAIGKKEHNRLFIRGKEVWL